jgi:phosphoribosylglycinamide formyltransferase-1
VETFVVTFPGSDRRAEWGEKLADTLESYSPDLVVLSGLMRLLPPETVQRFQGRLINTHPSYLPDFPGAHAVGDQVEAGVSDAGASIIVVDNGVDTGPIIEQQRVAVMPDDSEASLHARIKQVERELLWRVLTELAGGQRTLPVGQD